MREAIEWVDSYYNDSNRIVLTQNELQIPGLRMLGKHKMVHAIAPLPDHFHKDCFEFTFVTNGTISFSVKNTSYHLSGYDVFVTQPNEIHSTNLEPISKGEIIWFQLDAAQTNNLLFLNAESSSFLLSQLKVLNHSLIKIENNSLLSEMKKVFRLSFHPENKYYIANLLSFILFHLIEYSHIDKDIITPDIKKSIDYIQTNITSELSLDFLAKYISLSTSQFKQKFKSQTGVAPRHYINMKKMEYSKQLLINGLSITDVSMALGFNTSSYYAAVFKKYNTCTPTQYKESELLNKEQ